jgi:hypothetical protein
MSLEEHAQKVRADLIPAARRRELDKIADRITDTNERRYLVAAMKDRSRDQRQWLIDANKHDRNAIKLATVWKVSRMQATRRLKQLQK